MSDPEIPQGAAGNGPALKVQVLELLVFLFLIVPSLLESFLVVRQGGLSFPMVAGSVIVRDLALVSLVLFLVWRNHEPFGRIGWTLRSAGRDGVLGIVLFSPFFYGAAFLGSLLRSAGFTSPSAPPSFLIPRGAAEALWALALVAVVAVAEETIFRGYLILRLRSLTKSAAAAVVLSSVIFSLGHGYEGAAGVIDVGVMGVVFALIFLWRGSLVTPMVMHFLQDFVGIVAIPWIGLR